MVKKQPIQKKEEKKEESTLKIRVKVKSYDHKIIDQAVTQIVETARRSGANIAGPVPLPTERHVETVIRSPFVHKNSREQYEMRIHKRLLDIVKPTPKTMEALTELNLPKGVDVEVKM